MPSSHARDHYYQRSYESAAQGVPRPQYVDHNHDAFRHYARPGPATHIAPRSRRRWPPPPSVEDEELSLSHEYKPAQPDTRRCEGRMRGSVDQQPIILEVDLHTSNVHPGRFADSENEGTGLKTESSDESLGPRTPPENLERNQDRRYIYIPKEGIEIPLTYDEPKKPAREAKGLGGPRAEGVRGRKDNPPKLDTNMPQRKDNGITRQPSPYSYPPSPAAKSRFSGEYFLSPDTISPGARFPSDSRNAKSKRPEGGNIHLDPLARNAGTYGATAKPLERPMINRHVSASAYPGQPLHASSHSRSARYDSSSDDSDDENDHYPNVYNDKRSSRDFYERSDQPRHVSTLRYEDMIRREIKDGQGQITPPPRPVSAFNARTPPVGVPPLGGLGPGVTNALLSDPRRKKPSSASRVSPSTSPYSSPPRTPRVDGTRYGESLPVVGMKSRPSSRPTTPTSSDPMQPRSPAFESFHENRPAAHPAIGIRSSRTSQLPSPLPSPNFDRLTSSSRPRIDIQAPSPANQQKAFTIPVDGSTAQERAPASFVLPPAPQSAPRSSSRHPRPSSYCESPPGAPMGGRSPRSSFELSQPPPQNYAPTAPREQGHNPDHKHQLALPPCPRPSPVAGYHDWYILNGKSSFNLCPTCRTQVANAGYGGYFIPSPPKAHSYATRCEFSIPWVRMAWLLTLKQQRPDLNLLYAQAEVATRETPCPGKAGAGAGPWFRLTDPVAGKTVPNFDVCPSCVRSLETIFPTLHGVFQHMPSSPTHEPRPCALRASGKRFATYVDLLEEIATHSLQTRTPPSTQRFVALARQMSLMRE